MDREQLDRYNALRTEIDDLRERIVKAESKLIELATTVVADSVEGTRPDGTYGAIKIKGIPVPAYEAEARLLHRQKCAYERLCASLSAETATVEDFINRVSETQTRTILRLRYLDGKTWEQVARAVRKNPDQCRMMINRFFAKKT